MLPPVDGKGAPGGKVRVPEHGTIPMSSTTAADRHSLHENGTRTCPGAAEMRFGAPHFPHLASIRVLPCFTVMVLRSIASLTNRSDSSRIASFDISHLF